MIMYADHVIKSLGRYALCSEFAKGGIATVHFGRLMGPAGFGRMVAIKRLFPEFARDSEFIRVLIDEARLAARVNHPNVVQTLDVVFCDDEACLVMEYVRGVPLSLLMKRARQRGQRIDVGVVSSVMSNVFHGLHAAHEATDEYGRPLKVVHRDVSPQNLLCGVDGITRVDFGIAKTTGYTAMTRDGYVKGKLAYMSPEQIMGAEIDRRTDIFAGGVVLWELLTGERLFGGGRPGEVVGRIIGGAAEAPSHTAPWVGVAFDAIVLQCLERDRNLRFATARESAMELEECSPMAPASEIGAWVEDLAGDVLEVHRELLKEIESGLAGQQDSLCETIVRAPSVLDGEEKTPSGDIAAPPEEATNEVRTDEIAADSESRSFALAEYAPPEHAPPETRSNEQAASVLAVGPFEAARHRGQLTRAFLAAAFAMGVATAVLLFWPAYHPVASGDTHGPTASSVAGESRSPAFLTPPDPCATPSQPSPNVVATTSSAQGAELQPPVAPLAGGMPRIAAPAPLPRTDSNSTIRQRVLDCSPPFVIDVQGIKTYRVECL